MDRFIRDKLSREIEDDSTKSGALQVRAAKAVNALRVRV
jgi:hypothetical protein